MSLFASYLFLYTHVKSYVEQNKKLFYKNQIMLISCYYDKTVKWK